VAYNVATSRTQIIEITEQFAERQDLVSNSNFATDHNGSCAYWTDILQEAG